MSDYGRRGERDGVKRGGSDHNGQGQKGESLHEAMRNGPKISFKDKVPERAPSVQMKIRDDSKKSYTFDSEGW